MVINLSNNMLQIRNSDTLHLKPMEPAWFVHVILSDEV